MFGLEYFSWSAQWSPFFLAFVIAIGVAYALAVGKYRQRWFRSSQPASFKEKAYFYAGLAVAYAAFGSPVDLLGHLIFSAHMASMALAYLIAPPLLLLGMPGWMLRPAVDRIIAGKAKFLLHPIVAMLLFNGLFSFYHIPAIHDFVMTNYIVHIVYYAVLFICALLMWWYMANPLPDFRPLSDLKRLGYVFANGVLLTPACALIIFAGGTLYATYSDADTWAQAMGFCAPGMDPAVLLERFGGPSYFAMIEPVHDQQLGGVIMKLTQEVMYGSILFYGFVRWYRKENPAESLDPEDNQELRVDAGGLNRA